MTKFHWRMAKTSTLALALIVVFILMGCGTTRQAVKPGTQQQASDSERLARERAEAEQKAKDAAEAAAKAEAEAKARSEAEAKARSEAEARTFDTVYFDYDRANIRGDQVPGLIRNAEKMKARPEFRITIEGHCDERGTIEYNLALGQRRAESARKFLAEQGVDASRMTTVSFGKERPADTGHNEAAWAKNRRAVPVVVGSPLSAR